MTEPTFFTSQAKWRTWLEKNHAKHDELLVGFHKAHTGKGGITYQQALDEALAFGWIDARRGGGDDTWTIRFTRRRATSTWSQVNIRRVGELTALGRMHAAGVTAFEARDVGKQNRYSNENKDAKLSFAEQKAFRANKDAWAWFQAAAPSYRHPATWWVVSAKKDETRARRLATLIADSAAGRRIPPMRPTSRKTP